MSEISDKLIDETFKGVIPYITPWRVVLTAVGIVLISTSLSAFNPKDMLSLSLLIISKKLITTSTETPVWKLAIIALTVFLAIPKSGNFFIFFLIKKIHIPRCEFALLKLSALKKHSPTKLASLFGSRVSELYEARKSGIKKIQRLRLVFEMLLGSCAFLIAVLIKIDRPTVIWAPLAISLIFLFILSKKITFLYLDTIAPSSIIFESLRKIGTFRRSQSSF